MKEIHTGKVKKLIITKNEFSDVYGKNVIEVMPNEDKKFLLDGYIVAGEYDDGELTICVRWLLNAFRNLNMESE